MCGAVGTPSPLPGRRTSIAASLPGLHERQAREPFSGHSLLVKVDLSWFCLR